MMNRTLLRTTLRQAKASSASPAIRSFSNIRAAPTAFAKAGTSQRARFISNTAPNAEKDGVEPSQSVECVFAATARRREACLACWQRERRALTIALNHPSLLASTALRLRTTSSTSTLRSTSGTRRCVRLKLSRRRVSCSPADSGRALLSCLIDQDLGHSTDGPGVEVGKHTKRTLASFSMENKVSHSSLRWHGWTHFVTECLSLFVPRVAPRATEHAPANRTAG